METNWIHSNMHGVELCANALPDNNVVHFIHEF